MPDNNVNRSVAVRSWPTTVFGVILAIIGLILAIGGVRLVSLGGSWYYLIAGAAMVVSGVLYVRQRMLGAWIYLAVFIGTLLWTFAEVGTEYWGLVPRLAPVLVLGFFAALLAPRFGGRPFWGLGAALVQLIVLIIGGVAMFQPQGGIWNTVELAQAPEIINDPNSPENTWKYYGRTLAGTRYAPFDQINRDNVSELEVAWVFRTGEVATQGSEDQNTPVQVGDTLYICTPRDKVFALNAETGEQRWMFDPQVESNRFWNRCRGVAYFDTVNRRAAAETAGEPNTSEASTANAAVAPAATAESVAADGVCATRILTTTSKAELYALDARTGEICTDFGEQGRVDLTVGLGELKDWYYMPTSQPTVAGGVVVIGGWVWDGREIEEPSGVVRAYDAMTGELAWAWDLGNPDITHLPPEGETYTRGTPNYWSTAAVDEELGMVYLPLGNGTPDFWGAHRSEATEEYSTSVVALDLATGREVWHRQTTHHDIWDYDNGTPPALIDLPDGNGGTVPALLLATKTAQLYLLDRRTGEPLAEIEELPVPQDVMAGDWVSPTQPFSVGMPSIGDAPLTEERMWGATFFDQLYCRIKFRQLRYEGIYTPITTDPTLIFPGYYGGMNWGGVAIDETNKILVVNDIRQAQIAWLVPRDEVEEAVENMPEGFGIHMQEGTPYAAIRGPFNSFLDIPCQMPMWGSLTAVDLKSREIVWQTPLGTIQDVELNGIRVRAPIPIGMPTLGGPIVTAGGLVFYSGTQDYYLRAFDLSSGKEVWKGRLPVGAQATPMTYISPESGRQFVVTSASGARMSPDRGDYVVAYALPKR